MNWTPANCATRAFSRRRRAFGALDLGTNNCRLMIAVAGNPGFSVVDSFSRIVRLGEGLEETGALSVEAQERTLDALKVCAELAARWELVGLRCVATEACRSASNGPAFIARVRAETGLKFDIIDVAEEAQLAAKGCSPLMARASQQAAIFDIGGGSTEVTLIEAAATAATPRRRASRNRRRHRKVHVKKVISLPFGVVRLSDRFGDAGLSGSAFDDVRQQVAAHVSAEFDPEPFAKAGGHLIGTSGTATSLSALAKGMKRYRRCEIDGSWLTASEIDGLINRLLDLGLEGRRAEPCIGSGRADLIMPGCAILRGVLDAAGCDSVRVADRGLREGLITELLAKDRRAVVKSPPGLVVPAPAK